MKIIIKAKDIKVPIGHTNHVTGTGVHADKRKRRQKTRSARFQAQQKNHERRFHESNLRDAVTEQIKVARDRASKPFFSSLLGRSREADRRW